MAYTFSQQQTGMRDDGIPLYQNRTQRILNRNAQNERQKQAEIKFNQLKAQADDIRAGITDFEDYKQKYANLSPDLKQFFQSPEQVQSGIKAQQQADISKVQSTIQQKQQKAEAKRQQIEELNRKASSYSTEDYNRNSRELDISLNELNREIDLLQQNVSKIEQGYDYNSIIDYAEKKAGYESSVSRENDIIKQENALLNKQTDNNYGETGTTGKSPQLETPSKTPAGYIELKGKGTVMADRDKSGNITYTYTGLTPQPFSFSSSPADILQPEKPIIDNWGNVIGVQSTAFQQTLTIAGYNKKVADYNAVIEKQAEEQNAYWESQSKLTKGRYTAEELKEQQYRLTAEGGYLPAKLDIGFQKLTTTLGLGVTSILKKGNLAKPLGEFLEQPAPDWVPRTRASDILKFGLFLPFMETTGGQIPELKKAGIIQPQTEVELMATVRQLEGDVSRSRSVGVVKTGSEKSVVMTDQLVKNIKDIEGKIASENIGKGVSTVIRKTSKGGMDVFDVTQSNVVSRGKAVGDARAIREGRGQILVDETFGEGLLSKSESTGFRKLIEKQTGFITEKITKRTIKGFEGPTKSQQGTTILSPLDDEASLFRISGTTNAEVTKELLSKETRQIGKSPEGYSQMEITETFKRSIKLEPPLSVKIRGILKVIKDETKEPVYDITGDFVKSQKPTSPLTFEKVGKGGEMDIDALVKQLDKNTQKSISLTDQQRFIKGLEAKEDINQLANIGKWDKRGELMPQEQALRNFKESNIEQSMNKLEKDLGRSDILKSEIRQKNIKLSKSFQLPAEIQAEAEFQQMTIIKRVESKIVKAKITKGGLGSSNMFQDLIGQGKIKGLGTTGKFGDMGVFEGRIKSGSLGDLETAGDLGILKDEIKLRDQLFEGQPQNTRNQQKFKDELKFKNVNIDDVLEGLDSQFKLKTELKLRQGLKEETMFKQDLTMAPFDFDMNIPKGPLGLGLVFGDLWGEPQGKKKLKRKLKQIDILGTSSDFTSKVLGLEPEVVSMKDLEKKLSKLDSGFGIRRGIKIKW